MNRVMRFIIFLCAAAILALGAASHWLLSKDLAVGFLNGSLQLGGGIAICGFFSLKSRWHGIVGAGVMALLGAARGLGNLPGLLRYAAGERPRGSAPLLELAVTAISLVLLFKVIRALSQERERRLLESGGHRGRRGHREG